MAAVLAGCGSRGPYGWLRPAAPPAEWSTMAASGGAAIAYPPGWRQLRGDPGTATAALLGPRDRFLGYLNLTPRQGDERLGTWAAFRLEHNREEGDSQVDERSHAGNLHFRGGARGACVSDRYRTKVGTHYIEIACLVIGRRSATVVVAAAPPDDWSKVSPTLERAISTLAT